MSSTPMSAHRCHMYRDAGSQSAALTAFLLEGLNAGGQCRIVAYTEAPRESARRAAATPLRASPSTPMRSPGEIPLIGS